MIAALLVVVGLALLALPAVVVPSRLPGAEWTRFAATSLALGFAALETGLVLVALPAVLRALSAAGLAAWCEEMTAPVEWGDWVGWTAAVVALAIGARTLWIGRHSHQDACAVRVESWIGRHEDRGAFELVVLPTEDLVAVSVPGSSPQVLISDGLVRHLDADQLDVVIRHEAMHHRLEHWRFSLLAVTIQRTLAPLPFVGRSTRELRTAVEAWADEATIESSRHTRSTLHGAITSVVGGSAVREHDRPLRSTSMRLRRLDQGSRGASLGSRFAVNAPLIGLGAAFFGLFGGWAMVAFHVAPSAGWFS